MGFLGIIKALEKKEKERLGEWNMEVDEENKIIEPETDMSTISIPKLRRISSEIIKPKNKLARLEM